MVARPNKSSPDARASGEKGALRAPSIVLPRGGGAIRGIGEKFATNPVTGTGSVAVPLATTPGRSGFGPQLALSYDSGAGNGLFGFGWSLSLPSITRKTDKGLPRYRDAEESDVYLLSGAEDLVPVVDEAGTRHRDVRGSFRVERYRPRVEGTFARIERWTNDQGEIHWRSISKDNVTTHYGATAQSRVADPSDARRVFSWLICESHDDKGNAVVYEYRGEDAQNVDLSAASEKSRSRTAGRYLKRIRYGNRVSQLLDPTLAAPLWTFEVVFDYGEGHHVEESPDDDGRVFVRASRVAPAGASWLSRRDAFSSYRAGFEVRTHRLCRRVLVFHHFPNELEGLTDAAVAALPEAQREGLGHLVGSTELEYDESGQASLVRRIRQSGYSRQADGSYLKKSLPPLEFDYSEIEIDDTVRDIDPASLENLPCGLDGSRCQWIDLDGDGTSGILAEHGGTWFYKRNLSPVNGVADEHAPGRSRVEPWLSGLEVVPSKPALALSAGAQLLDLEGDGRPDLVQLEGPVRGFYERSDDAGWETFRPLASWPNVDTHDPNLRFIDLDGDGRSDVLITANDVLAWHPSIGEEGFGPPRRSFHSVDEADGPRVVFADGTQSIYLADMSGDGLSDLVRVRNGEVSYWPNLGYGRFGAKVTMDDAPWFDAPDQFDQRRIRIADIDGTGVSDLIYLSASGPRLYFNQAGNRWSAAIEMRDFPPIDNLASVVAVDLLGNGTACLVWSSPLPGSARSPMRYLDLMGGQKPHLLVKWSNNLGAETTVHYAPSTKFYLADKLDGHPWITRIPFPVHVVERVETHDLVSRNRFVSRYAYHHGYFDGVEREFRGFGRVDQWDTERLEALVGDVDPDESGLDRASHVPPVLTKTWFHTGVHLGRDRLSRSYAGLVDGSDRGEYYRERAWLTDDAQARARLLDDTELPPGLTLEEEREACRALKGSMLRQEVYALDGSGAPDHPDGQPYTVTEQSFTVRRLQARSRNRHGVFLTHARETISYQYERDDTDPRVGHALTLEVDDFGNVLKSAAVAYGRRSPDPELTTPEDRVKQTRPLITYTENDVTNAIDGDDAHRAPLPGESRTYEIAADEPSGPAGRYRIADFVAPSGLDSSRMEHVFTGEVPYEEELAHPGQRRLVERVRTLYRKDDLSDLLSVGVLESLAVAGESYKLAFTPGLLAKVYARPAGGQPADELLPYPADVLPTDDAAGRIADRGGYVDLDADGHWWLPSGRVFFSPDAGDSSTAELAHARRHFFLQHRLRDPFGATTRITYDRAPDLAAPPYDLLLLETEDALGNRVTVGERDAGGVVRNSGNDYRVLQPRLITDPNGNRTEVAFDALGFVVATAARGKDDATGDNLNGFERDLTQSQLDAFHDAVDPHVPAASLLRNATTRVIYDVGRFHRTRTAHPEDRSRWLPACAAVLARETHVDAPLPPHGLRIQIGISYSDGLGREIQKKIQAEPGPVIEGGPVVAPRWVGSGWTVFDSKGRPVRRYEPFFSRLPDRGHRFEFGARAGVSAILFYDPLGRAVATLHPNHTYEKLVFDAWRQRAFDVNDTAAPRGVQTGDARTDPDVAGFVATYFAEHGEWKTWREQRAGGDLGAAEQTAAVKTTAHADTPTTAYLDPLGRPFLTVAVNGFASDGTPIAVVSRADIDIEGNQRVIRDASVQDGDRLGRIVMRCAYDMLGNRICQQSMDAGERWVLNDVAGNPIRTWNARGNDMLLEYDGLRRPKASFLRPASGPELLLERRSYGEERPGAEDANLRGKVVEVFDQAGVVTSDAYDFKGNLLRSRRKLAEQYRAALDWSTPVALEAAAFESRTEYDALNRITALTSADASVTRPTYNEANLLERVDVHLNGAAIATPFVIAIDYDAKGQRTRIDYHVGGGAGPAKPLRTKYTYDPDTFRLVRLVTTRGDDFPAADRLLQDLQYTYDPVGNVTEIRDRAQQTVYFRNRRVEPSNEYTYDALYRLTEATGREHLGLTGAQPNAPRAFGPFEAFHDRLDHPGDGDALGTYAESYVYDLVGNILSLQHRGTDPAHAGWTRTYEYDEASRLEPAKTSNRLTRTSLGGLDEVYSANGDGYDAHGNTLRMPHLSAMRWDDRDQMRSSARQVSNAGTPETTWYVYDVAGQRIRKVTDRQAAAGQTPMRMKERIYLGAVEIYREFEADGSTAELERQSLHIMDDKRRVALVETTVVGAPPGADPRQIRYQLGNHLGSVSLEVDDRARIVSYEEYTPYGATSYQAVKSQIEAAKRHRYTGKERDEESGLYYHGARYYAPWLGRWTSADPAGVDDGPNGYRYVGNNPVLLVDPNGSDGQVNQLMSALLRERTRNPEGFVAFLARNETQLYPALSQFGYRGCFTSDAQYLQDFDAAAARWSRRTGYVVPLPLAPPDEARQNEVILGALPDGTGYVGTRRSYDRAVQRQVVDRQLRTLDNIRGGIGGAIGYAVNGDRGSDVGAAIDGVATAMAPVAGVRSRAAGPPGGRPPRSVRSSSAPPPPNRGGTGPVQQPRPPGPPEGPPAVGPSIIPGVQAPPPVPGPRTARDMAVNPTAPPALPLDRPIGRSATQNAELQADIASLRAAGATDFRVNQHQVDASGRRVGINRPDLQFTAPNGQRFYVEYDTPSSNRGALHLRRIYANDPQGQVILKTVP